MLTGGSVPLDGEMYSPKRVTSPAARFTVADVERAALRMIQSDGGPLTFTSNVRADPLVLVSTIV